MKIGFDGKRALRNMTGLGNYSRFVIESLAEECPDSSFVLFAPKNGDAPRLKSLERDNIKLVTPSTPLDSEPRFSLTPSSSADERARRDAAGAKRRRMPGALWRTWGLTGELKRRGIQLYHGLSNELPLNIRNAGIPSVVTIHDVIYRRLPQCYALPDRLIYDYKYGHSARNADRVIAISERTKLDVMEFYGVPEERIDVIYQGCDESFLRHPGAEELAAIRNRYRLPERFILQVGTIEWRKNLELTVKAIASLPGDVELIAVGRDRGGYADRVMETARRLGTASRIRILSGVTFPELPLLYRLATASAYPSRYEGFGIPILEAQSSGCPVAAATGSCLEEAGGNAALYADPDDPRGLADALRQLITPGPRRSQLIADGENHVRKFSNPRVAAKIIETYIHAKKMHIKN